MFKILTKDSVTVTVDAVVYFRIFDPVASVINVENAQWDLFVNYFIATTINKSFKLVDIQLDYWRQQHFEINWAQKLYKRFYRIEKA